MTVANDLAMSYVKLLGSYAFGIVFAFLIAPLTGQPWWAIALAFFGAWLLDELVKKQGGGWY